MSFVVTIYIIKVSYLNAIYVVGKLLECHNFLIGILQDQLIL